MREWLRRIRGAVGMGLTWAVGWVLVGVVLTVALWVTGFDPPGFFRAIAALFAALGFLGGSIFSVILGFAEGSRRFEELSIPRFAAWGAAGGLLLGGLAVLALFGGPTLQRADAVVVGITTLLGAGSAVGTLALARAAADEPLLAAGGKAAELSRPGGTSGGTSSS